MNQKNDRRYCVYKHTCPNGLSYVGYTGMTPVEKRWKNGDGYFRNLWFVKQIDEYGWDNIKHEIIVDGLLKEEALILEKYYMWVYKSELNKSVWQIKNELFKSMLTSS